MALRKAADVVSDTADAISLLTYAAELRTAGAIQ